MGINEEIQAALNSHDAQDRARDTALAEERQKSHELARLEALAVSRAQTAEAALELLQKRYDDYVASHPDPVPEPSPERPSASLAAVRVFPSYRDKVYGNHEAVLERLAALGVKRMSHKFSPAIANLPDVIDFTQRAYQEHGIKSWLTMGEPRVVLSRDEWDTMEAALRGPLSGMVELVSGWNEPNHVRGGGTLPADWHVKAVEHNRELYRRFRDVVPKIGTPQLWSGDFARHDSDVAKLTAAGIVGSFNTITWHLYPRGNAGEDLLQRFETLYRSQWGDSQIICTEGGYLDAANYTGGARNLTPEQKAELVPQFVDSYVKRGYGVSYFELLDDPDPTEADREASLGLVECKGLDPSTWSNKPAFDSLRAYLTK